VQERLARPEGTAPDTTVPDNPAVGHMAPDTTVPDNPAVGHTVPDTTVPDNPAVGLMGVPSQTCPADCCGGTR